MTQHETHRLFETPWEQNQTQDLMSAVDNLEQKKVTSNQQQTV